MDFFRISTHLQLPSYSLEVITSNPSAPMRTYCKKENICEIPGISALISQVLWKFDILPYILAKL